MQGIGLWRWQRQEECLAVSFAYSSHRYKVHALANSIPWRRGKKLGRFHLRGTSSQPPSQQKFNQIWLCINQLECRRIFYSETSSGCSSKDQELLGVGWAASRFVVLQLHPMHLSAHFSFSVSDACITSLIQQELPQFLKPLSTTAKVKAPTLSLWLQYENA